MTARTVSNLPAAMHDHVLVFGLRVRLQRVLREAIRLAT
jgi:hypothetical protein